jgi:enoyl-CoA hydratase
MPDVTLERDGAVAVLTIDNPEVRNGLTPEMGHRVTALCDEVDGDESIGAVVVRGAAGTFCSGADTRTWDPNLGQTTDEGYARSNAVYGAFARVGQLKVATIAAVRGAAVGAGMNLMLATDLRVVSEEARLLSGFLKIGLHPGGGFFTIANRTAGREATAAMGLFSQEISGRRAVEIGLAWEAVPDDEVEDRAIEMAHIAGRDPLLTRRAVKSFRSETGPPQVTWEAALEIERGVQMWSQHRRLQKQQQGER